MPDLGPHASFIIAAYAVTGLAVGALIWFILGEDRKQRRLLAELERRGIRRRSAKPQGSKPNQAKPAAKAKPPRGRGRRKPKS
jgi:heme exporter protein D